LELVLLLFEATEGKELTSAAQIGIIICANAGNESNSLDVPGRSRSIVKDAEFLLRPIVTIYLPVLSEKSRATGRQFYYKGKVIPVQAWTGADGSRTLRLPDFQTISTWW
jgi:hypothetical protein